LCGPSIPIPPDQGLIVVVEDAEPVEPWTTAAVLLASDELVAVGVLVVLVLLVPDELVTGGVLPVLLESVEVDVFAVLLFVVVELAKIIGLPLCIRSPP
jgi:hypothetical protein